MEGAGRSGPVLRLAGKPPIKGFDRLPLQDRAAHSPSKNKPAESALTAQPSRAYVYNNNDSTTKAAVPLTARRSTRSAECASAECAWPVSATPLFPHMSHTGAVPLRHARREPPSRNSDIDTPDPLS